MGVCVFMTVSLIQANITPFTVFSDRMKVKCSQWCLVMYSRCRPCLFSVTLGRFWCKKVNSESQAECTQTCLQSHLVRYLCACGVGGMSVACICLTYGTVQSTWKLFCIFVGENKMPTISMPGKQSLIPVKSNLSLVVEHGGYKKAHGYPWYHV